MRLPLGTGRVSSRKTSLDRYSWRPRREACSRMFFRSPYADALIVVVVLLLFFGPKRLPALGKSLGQGMREFKDSISGKSKHSDEAEHPELEAATPPPAAGVPEQPAPAATQPSPAAPQPGQPVAPPAQPVPSAPQPPQQAPQSAPQPPQPGTQPAQPVPSAPQPPPAATEPAQPATVSAPSEQPSDQESGSRA